MFAVKCIFIVLISTISIKICQSADNNADTILQVHVTFRHGDRTIEDPGEGYPNDPHRSVDLYPVTQGQLTNRGKQRAYKLGKMLRQRYNDFLGEFYDAEIVQTVSTDFDRTKMTAQLVLAGLFPPNSVQQWDEDLLWQPIPVNFLRLHEDYWLVDPTSYCPKYIEIRNKFINEIDSEVLKENENLVKYIEENSGKELNKLREIFDLRQTFLVEEHLNLTLPKWVQRVYPEPISSLAAKELEMESYTTLLKRLNGGNCLRKMLKNIGEKLDGTLKPKGRKIYLYSAHETNVMKVLGVLNVWDQKIPLFCSAVIIELVHRNATNENGIKVFYYNQIAEEPILLTVPGCGDSFCEINKFIEVTKDVVPKNYTLECNSKIDIHTFPWE
ncbi:venom acid phosphatase Acph-1-like [Chrysoperla carnea]|uniref:venom acid phosphatase Acph-1-like n=1 Tax=Chrysoperla carnea TaxID=189513 RepID=UPI001D073698|nr:venom acid phosphatase Acph-1-like [Chrysoperla carnea]